MSYILMTKMQYLHLTGVIPRMNNSFESDWEKQNKERFKRNHPLACSHDDERKKTEEKIYQKFNFGSRPKEPLANDQLIDAIKTCSEYPSKCFYLEEALSQLGHWHVFSYKDRFNALMQVTSMGSAVLVEEGFGGGVAATTKVKKERFIGENVACEYLGRHDNNSGVAWDAIRAHRNTYPGLIEADRNAEHYLYALKEVQEGSTSWAYMNILTDGYTVYKGALNGLQKVSFGLYKSPFRGSPATWSENLSGHLGADDAIFGVKCDDEK